MKISILLPYKENFSPIYPGAVSLFVNDTLGNHQYLQKLNEEINSEIAHFHPKDEVCYDLSDQIVNFSRKKDEYSDLTFYQIWEEHFYYLYASTFNLFIIEEVQKLESYGNYILSAYFSETSYYNKRRRDYLL